jgi:hypothetical protein
MLGDYQVASERHVPTDDWQGVKFSYDTDLVVFMRCL